MNKSIYLLISLLFITSTVDAQKLQENKIKAPRCNTMSALEHRLQTDEAYRKFHTKAMNMPSMANRSAANIPCSGSNSVVIPVAFHFQDGTINNGCTDANCLLTDLTNQMEVLNAAFGDNTGTSQEALCPQAYQDAQGNSVASTGTCISFCFATPPIDNTQGLSQTDSPITIGAFTGGIEATNGTGAPGWENILNIFITNGDCAGVSDGLPGVANGDGVSVCAEAFGAYGTTAGCGLNESFFNDLGTTLVHEVGHYLGLFHVWGDGSCGETDVDAPGPIDVLDTPDAPVESEGFPSGCIAGCNGDFAPWANFMDYSVDAAVSMFTQDQAMVMNYWANQLFGNAITACSPNQTPTTVGSCTFSAVFTPEDGRTINLCLDNTNTYDLTDFSSPSATSWQWNIVQTSGDLAFSPQGTNASDTQNPSLTFTGGSSGVLQITLTVTDGNGNSNTTTNNITFNLVSGAACSGTCDFILSLTDEEGDGWNGAIVEFFEDGISVGTFGQSFNNGSTDGPYTVALTDGATITVKQIDGDFPNEEGFTLKDSNGINVAVLAQGFPNSQNFIANCPQLTTVVNFKLFLEGPYNTATGEMTTALNSNNLIPLVQPYNVAPYNYNGSESVVGLPSADITDWVLVQARDASNFSTVVESRACFVLKDGTLMDIDGSVGVNFSSLNNGINYRFAIYHKGHLGVLTSTNISAGSTTIYDFTTLQTMAEGMQQIKQTGSIFALYAGDYDNNGIINNQDFNLWTSNSATVNSYEHYEADLNGIVNNLDYNLWTGNRSKVGELNIQLP